MLGTAGGVIVKKAAAAAVVVFFWGIVFGVLQVVSEHSTNLSTGTAVVVVFLLDLRSVGGFRRPWVWI